VWASRVGVLPPSLDKYLAFCERIELFASHALVSQLAFETFAIASWKSHEDSLEGGM
jgi:hypothetical protein